MALAFYDEEQNLYSANDEFFTHHDGRIGGAVEKIFYIRNDDPTRYYTNVTLTYVVSGYQDLGEMGTTGWGVKFIYGERRPTEAEWDEVRSGEPIDLPNIGSKEEANTYQYHPVWARIFCPGNTAAQRRKNQKFKLSFYEKLVGA